MQDGFDFKKKGAANSRFFLEIGKFPSQPHGVCKGNICSILDPPGKKQKKRGTRKKGRKENMHFLQKERDKRT